MPETTICPYCNAKLRIASASKRPQRVKCTVCKSHFHPSQVISGGGGSRWLNQPLTGAASEDDADSIAHRAAVQTDANAEFTGPSDQSIDPAVKKAAYPEEMLERREARRQERTEHRDEEPRRKRHYRKARGFQKVLVLLLVGTGIAGLVGAAWYLLRPAERPIELVENPPPIPDDLPRASPPSALQKDFMPKPLPQRLIGVWELRSDDERRGWIEFRSDNSLSMKAWRAEVDQTPLNTKWFLIQDEGDDVVFEIGQRLGTMGNPRFSISFTGQDAFTLTSVKDGNSPVPRPECLRYVRWTIRATASGEQQPAR